MSVRYHFALARVCFDTCPFLRALSYAHIHTRVCFQNFMCLLIHLRSRICALTRVLSLDEFLQAPLFMFALNVRVCSHTCAHSRPCFPARAFAHVFYACVASHALPVPSYVCSHACSHPCALLFCTLTRTLSHMCSHVFGHIRFSPLAHSHVSILTRALSHARSLVFSPRVCALSYLSSHVYRILF